LRGLKYIHSAGILHRDLKPRNLLVNSNSDLKICDFGLARADIPVLQTHSLVLTDYIATRWYRAPEVLLSWKNYSYAIDIWSVGCILAEMMLRAPLFPGHDQEEQIQMIVDLIGYPTEEEIQSVSSNSQGAQILSKIPPNEGVNFREYFENQNEEAIDLMEKMLKFDPSKRITVEDALNHPYLKDLHFEDDEPVAE